MESEKRTYDLAFNTPPNNPQRDDDDDDAPLHAVPINCYNNNDPLMTINDLEDRRFEMEIMNAHDEDDGDGRGQQEQQPDADRDSQLLLLLLDHIKTKFGYEDVTHLKIVYERKLTKTDAKGQQARLAILKTDLITSFLTQSEDLWLSWKDYTKENGNLKIPVKVIVGSSEYQMSLTRWNYHDNSNKDDNNNSSSRKKAKNNNTNNSNSSSRKKANNNNNNKGEQQPRWKYVLNKKWNDVRTENNLKEGDKIRLVSFRSNNYIHLAIVKQRTMMLMGTEIALPEYLVDWPRN